MFDNFSQRSIRIVFATRVRAGQRGADAMDVADLISGIIGEDQNDFSSLLLGGLRVENAQVVNLESHESFFDTEIAAELLVGIEGLLSHSSPVSTEADLPLTPELRTVFIAAEDLRKQTHRSQIEPLHLLAAVLQQREHRASELLQKAGITEELVLGRLGDEKEE